MTRQLNDWFALSPAEVQSIETRGPGPQGHLNLTDDMLRNWPSGDLFGLTQNVGMGWNPQMMGGPQFLLLSTLGGMRGENGQPIALGYHTGHWEVGLQVRAAAETITRAGGIPYAAYCSDPCDGRSQGTTGMFDSLPYRNDAAIVMRRLIRSLPTRQGVLAVATCDKGLPAAMLALAGCQDLPGVIVPGGVTLPPTDGEDTAKVQTIGARYVHGELSLEDAAAAGCRACGSPGGGCQFLGTAATAQVVAEALGMTVPHAALAPSGQAVWLDMARYSAESMMTMAANKQTLGDILTQESLSNAIAVHAACGGSTNLLLHIPAIAHAAGLQRPSVADWSAVNRRVSRFVDVLPNGPVNHPTVRMYLAGGVPEVMLHLRQLGVLHGECLTVSGQTWNEILDCWETSPRRAALRQLLSDRDGVDPDDVILPPASAKKRGLTSTVVFPQGNLCPEGSVIKATSIDPSVVGEDGVFRHTGPAKVFTSEKSAIAAIKGQGERRVESGDVLVLIGCGPLGTGMEETYQLTSALKHIPWGKHVTIVTDARFSGVSTGACIGHVGPEALAGGPLGRVQDGDSIEIVVDRNSLTGSVNLIGPEAEERLASRPLHASLAPDSRLPDDTRLWAALQQFGGGTWGGCVYDVDAIIEALERGKTPQGPQ
ncbi:YjhG/YagF family D-xylonate dehydratase [Aureliella helgolandensis]|uniref:Dihydroxy-acid dehydratase n=1 Tax=Aureliella helgolandensis TaxID=2527968 RepID=A0A518G1W0_9BACT|nr:YjhG/YagF family D-xylonate dehydratase [Aureliella helgolandensis]QDV22596.1 Dihydroxy-acid dehydratase [Aureliella helgolandensis]